MSFNLNSFESHRPEKVFGKREFRPFASINKSKNIHLSNTAVLLYDVNKNFIATRLLYNAAEKQIALELLEAKTEDSFALSRQKTGGLSISGRKFIEKYGAKPGKFTITREKIDGRTFLVLSSLK